MITDLDTQTVSNLGNGATTNYTIGFSFQDNDEVAVYLQDESGSPYTRTLLVYGAGAGKYTITGGDPGTTVVMGTAPTAAQRVVMKRVTALTQSVDYVETSAFPAQDHEEQMDRMVQIVQELDARVDKAIVMADVSSASAPTFPDPVASGFIRWNAGATGLETVVAASLGVPASGVANTPSGNLAANTVQGALNELQTELNTATAHLTNTSNPHSVTAAQVGNTVAQWNADSIQGKTVDDAAIADGLFLSYDSGTDTIVYAAPPTTPQSLDTTDSPTFHDLTLTGKQTITGSANEKQLLIKANAGQTSDLTTWQDSAGSDLALVDSTGTIFAVGFNGPLLGNVTGNVTGDVNGNVTGNLVGDVLAAAVNTTDITATNYTGITLDDVGAPGADHSINMSNKTLTWNFTNPNGGMAFNFTGAATGHSLDITQSGGNPGTDMHLLHIEASDADPTMLHMVPGSATSRALKVNPAGENAGPGRFNIDASGKQTWGDGTAAVDATLERTGAGALRATANLNVTGNVTSTSMTVNGGANAVEVAVRRNAGQTADIMQWQTEGSVELAAVEADGRITSTVGFTGNLTGTASGNIANTLVDAKGDLIVGSADNTPARLAVGANDKILMAASGEATGVKWDTPTATMITNTPSGNLAGATVQAALNELQGDIDGLTVASGGFNYVSKTFANSPYSAAVQEIIFFDADGGNSQVSFPAAAVGNSGKIIEIRKTGSSWTTTISLTTISRTMHTPGEIYRCVSTGSAWVVIDHRTETNWTSVSISSLLSNPGWSANTGGMVRRTGDTLEFDGFFEPTSGAGSGAGFGVTLPHSLAMDTAKLASGTNGRGEVGSFRQYDDNATPGTGNGWVRYNSTTSVLFMKTDSASFITASPQMAVGDAVTFHIKVPISGWTAN